MEMLMSGSISPTFLIIYPLQPSLKVRFVTSAVGFLLDAIDYQLLTASFFFYCRSSVCMEDFHHLLIR